MIEKSYFIYDIEALNNLPEDVRRIYVGSEYCIRAIPKNYIEIINRAKENYKITLILPPLLESEIDKALEIINKVRKNLDNPFEIVINDWGLLYLLSKEKDDKVSLVLGRILSYQKRGNQRLYKVIKSEDLGSVPILDDKMVNFLLNLGIKRIEIDIPPNGVKISKKPKVDLTIYTPFSLISYTLNCPFMFEKGVWRRTCNRECINNFLVYTGGDAITDFLQCGKIYFTKSANVIDWADRIVYISWEKKNTKI